MLILKYFYTFSEKNDVKPMKIQFCLKSANAKKNSLSMIFLFEIQWLQKLFTWSLYMLRFELENKTFNFYEDCKNQNFLKAIKIM